jgi:hypothetical protein
LAIGFIYGSRLVVSWSIEGVWFVGFWRWLELLYGDDWVNAPGSW